LKNNQAKSSLPNRDDEPQNANIKMISEDAMKLLALVLLVTSSILSHHAAAQVVTRCGASQGHEYFFPGSFVTAKDAAWQIGKISSGQTILMKTGTTYDIVYSDAFGRTLSSKEDGAEIVVISDDPGKLTLVLNYAGRSVETWMFRLDAKGKGEVTFSQARYNGPIASKHSLFRAACDKQAMPSQK